MQSCWRQIAIKVNFHDGPIQLDMCNGNEKLGGHGVLYQLGYEIVVDYCSCRPIKEL